MNEPGRNVLSARDRRLLSALAARWREQTSTALARAPRERAWRSLRQRLDGGRARAGWVWGAAGAAIASAAVAVWLGARAPEVSYVVERGRANEWGYVLPSQPGEAAVLRFSEGTEARLAAGSVARVVASTTHGADLALSSGRLSMDVRARPRAAWKVFAGPFTVAVGGTRFEVRWDEPAGEFEVVSRGGSVVVSGPVLQQPVALSPGMRLAARLREGAASIDSVAVAEPAPEAVAEPPLARAPVPARPPRPTRRIASVQASPEVVASWPRQVAQGRYDAVVADAERRGIPTVLVRAPRAELAALAGAAYYERRVELARAAWQSVRARFPGSVDARAAAFFLGRLEEDGAGDRGEALRWYDRYLAESPTGPFAAEALGRKLVAVENLRGRAAARAIAAEYLGRYPSGSHADLARRVASPP
jgi:TolA-binding protein